MNKLILKCTYALIAGALLASCNKAETAQPQQRDLIDAVFASGSLTAEHEYHVTANAEGYLSKSFVEVGSEVTANMPLFQLSNQVQAEQVANAEILYRDAVQNASSSSPQRQQLELQVAQAKSQLALDEKNYDRYKKLAKSRAVSQSEVEQKQWQYENALSNLAINEKALDDLVNSLHIAVENAKTQWLIQQESNADYLLKSRLNGVVLQVHKEEGDLVRKGEVIATVGGGKKLAKLFIAEEDINEIALNQKVVLNLNTDRQRTYDGFISKIYPSFDQVEQSFIVEARFTANELPLYHNTQLQANIIIGQREGALVIPSGFLLAGDSVKLHEGRFVPVQVGIRNDAWVEIVKGVQATDILDKPAAL